MKTCFGEYPIYDVSPASSRMSPSTSTPECFEYRGAEQSIFPRVPRMVIRNAGNLLLVFAILVNETQCSYLTAHMPELETHCSELSHSESIEPDKGLAAIQTFMSSNPIETSIHVWLLRRIPNPSALPLHANHQSRIGTQFHVLLAMGTAGRGGRRSHQQNRIDIIIGRDWMTNDSSSKGRFATKCHDQIS